MRAWLFLVLLLLFVFEDLGGGASYGASFVFSSYNAQSIAVFAVAPLLLALGETFVIIAGGIDLSVGFIMGLSAVVAAHGANIAGTTYMPAFPGHDGRDRVRPRSWRSIPGSRQRLADFQAEGSAFHRHARHVRRGARASPILLRRRNDGAGERTDFFAALG